jgi:hypothetical protein
MELPVSEMGRLEGYHETKAESGFACLRFPASPPQGGRGTVREDQSRVHDVQRTIGGLPCKFHLLSIVLYYVELVSPGDPGSRDLGHCDPGSDNSGHVQRNGYEVYKCDDLPRSAVA